MNKVYKEELENFPCTEYTLELENQHETHTVILL